MAERSSQYEQGQASAQDPTERSMQALLREIAALKELIFVRLDAMDKAMALFDKNLNDVPTETDNAIACLKEVMFQRFDVGMEKFRNIQTQFEERDKRVEQTSKDSKIAVDAAFAAAKEAVGAQQTSSSLAISKSETFTVKQIDALALLIQTGNKATDDKIDDLKDRLNRIEGEGRGEHSATMTARAGRTSTVNIIGLVIGSIVGAGGVVMALVSYFANNN